MRPCFVRLAGRSCVVSRRPFVRALPLLVGAFTAARGQLVTPKTIPIHQDEMYAIVPQARAGMAELSIALDDSLADPFINPGRLMFGRPTMSFVAPYSHNVTGGHGGGRTLPLGAMGSSGPWAGAFVAAVQDLDHKTSSNALNAGWLNRYIIGSVARRVRDDLTVGLSASYARLNAIDGADLLYDGSNAITEIGDVSDVRLGVTKRWGESRLDVVALNAQTNITHAVSYDWYAYNGGSGGEEYHSEVDHNLDRTRAWGLHTQFSQPIGDGWRLGWIATANRLSHPKIPDYEVKNIPFVWHDPGTTYGFNFGFGLARALEHSSYGFEFVQEPMTSHTWGLDANGEHTFDNRFRFSNWKLRGGVGFDIPASRDGAWSYGFQLGTEIYSIRYALDQENHIANTFRSATEAWNEWTPTFGFRVRAHGANIQYNWRLTCSRDCVPMPMGDKVTVPAASIGSTVIAAPTRAVNVDAGTSGFHQVLVSVQIP